MVILISLPAFHLNHGLIRPQGFTFCFLALILFMLVAADRGQQTWLLLVPPVIGV